MEIKLVKGNELLVEDLSPAECFQFGNDKCMVLDMDKEGELIPVVDIDDGGVFFLSPTTLVVKLDRFER